MNLRPLLVVGGATVAVMLAASAVAWAQIPEGTAIPIHWNLAGEADGYAPKEVGLLMTPAIAVGLLGLFTVLPAIEPRRRNLARSGPAYVTTTAAAIVFTGAVHLAVVWTALGNSIDIPRLIGVGSGLLFLVIGNMIGKTRSNWFLGVRTPWTLSSEHSWAKTHRLAGRLFAGLGALTLLAAITGIAELILAVVGGGTGLVVIAVVAYSYLAWRDDPERRAGPSEVDA
jgi:uncharacterized membrane protein